MIVTGRAVYRRDDAGARRGATPELVRSERYEVPVEDMAALTLQALREMEVSPARRLWLDGAMRRACRMRIVNEGALAGD